MIPIMPGPRNGEQAKPDSEAGKFLQFCALPETDKQRLLAFCVAVSLKPKLGADDEEPTAYDLALAQTGANVADYWRPTKDNFLSRITSSQLLKIGQDIFGGNFATQYAKAKKGELVALLDKGFANPEKALDPDKVRRLSNWLPEGMAFPAVEPPSASEPKPAKAKKSKKAA